MFRVKGLRCGVQGSRMRAQGLGLRIAWLKDQGTGFGFEDHGAGLGLKIAWLHAPAHHHGGCARWGSRMRVWGSGCRVEDCLAARRPSRRPSALKCGVQRSMMRAHVLKFGVEEYLVVRRLSQRPSASPSLRTRPEQARWYEQARW